jgi:hypothetical protein
MRKFVIVMLVFALSACSTPRAKPVDCDGHLTPINAPPAAAGAPLALNGPEQQADGAM